jgi:hypothetical protein
MTDMVKFQKCTALKVDDGLGLVFGWGMICTEKGADHFDLQGDHIPHSVMLDSVSDFMGSARVAKDMHTGEQIGMIVHSMPLTDEIAKAFGIQTEKTGWMVAFKPDSAADLHAFRTGARKGFSIGGLCSYEEVH